MARRTFGQSLTDFTITVGVDATPILAAGDVEITFWSAPTDGLNYDSLLDRFGAEVSFITSSDGSDGFPVGTIPEFQGPDGDVTELWADGGGGARFKMVATDLGTALAQVDTNTSTIADLQATVSGLAPVASDGLYSSLTGIPAFAPVATDGSYSALSGKPALGVQFVVKSGSWPLRSVSAPDTGRPAMWIGAAPAPPATAGYAIEGDLFMATA